MNRRDRLRQALAVYEDIIERDPRDWAARLRHATLAKKLGHACAAVASYLAAADELLRMGDPSRAEAVLSIAEEFSPPHPCVAAFRARLASERERRPAARVAA